VTALVSVIHQNLLQAEGLPHLNFYNASRVALHTWMKRAFSAQNGFIERA
jgi:hypothetical protein